jgi:hypothetical protein
MAQYDATVIGKFADDLYAKAGMIIALWTAGVAIVAAVLGYGGGGGTGVVLGLLIGGGLGFMIGQQRAFMLKLYAQMALCLAQIERNSQRST